MEQLDLVESHSMVWIDLQGLPFTIHEPRETKSPEHVYGLGPLREF